MAFSYYKKLQNGLVITTINPPEHAEALGVLQEIVFPTLAPEERMRPEHYYKHVELFPEGQFVALDGDRPVASTSTLRQNYTFGGHHPNFGELLQGGWMTSHDPNGEWLYGMDVAVHPDYRKMRLARCFYHARQATVRHLGLKGQLAGGMMIGYDQHRHLTPEQYYEKIKSGEIFDPTVSAQMRVGFEPVELLPNYLNDPTCDNYAVLIRLRADQEVACE